MADPSQNSQIPNVTSSLGEVKIVEEPILRPRVKTSHLIRSIEKGNCKYKEKILALPCQEGWVNISKLRKYKGFWILEEYLPGILAMEEAFKPRPNDIIVTSYVKSGTTWLKALTFAIVHRNKYAFSSHPFHKLNPQDCVPMIDFNYAVQQETYLETLPSPRVLGTHMPYSILPESIKTSSCPIVYICREPKDVIVSLWHFVTSVRSVDKESFPFIQLFELFCEGRVTYGPVWDHVTEYYMESLHKTDKVLFLKYEEMMKDSIDGAMRIAKFVGCPFSEEEVKNGVVKEIVELCSFNKLKDLEINKSKIDQSNIHFFRKAVVGDWQNHMTSEMAAKLDTIIKEKLYDSGFTFGSTSTN